MVLKGNPKAAPFLWGFSKKREILLKGGVSMLSARHVLQPAAGGGRDLRPAPRGAAGRRGL